MLRVLLASSLCCVACGPSFSRPPGSVQRPGGSPGDTDELVCTEEVTSPRGTSTPICRPRSQIEDRKRFAKDLQLDSHPRPTYNN